MKQILMSVALLLPLASFAGGDHPGRAGRIAKALNLNEADAARLEKNLAPFQAQAQPLREDLKSQIELLEKASGGDPAAAAQVDQAVQRISSDRAQLASLKQQRFQAASVGLSPAQKAKLALVMSGKQGRHERRGR